MNMRYTFAVVLHGRENETLLAQTTGSEETRARRRLLEALHSQGKMARVVRLAAGYEPVLEERKQ